MEKSEKQSISNRVLINTAGPEIPSLAEKFVRVLRLPYILGCIIWALVFLEIPILVQRLLSRHESLNSQEILYLVVVFLMSVYFPLSVRFVRTKVLEAETKLIPLLPGGEADYHEAFGRAVNYRGQILSIIVIALMAIYIIILTDSLMSRIIISINAMYVAFMLGSLIWFNLGCIIGLYRLGGKPIKFKSFREDLKLGTRPIGSLCLSLTGAYFIGVIILILFSTVSPNQLYKINYIYCMYGVLIIIGLTMFFLPLFRLHFRMVEEKAKQDILIQNQFDYTSHDLKSIEGEDQLLNIQKLLSLDMADRKLHSVSTWPFDTTLLSKFSVFLLSVCVALIARILVHVFIWPSPAP